MSQHALKVLPRFDELERDIDAGLELHLDLMAERAEVVAPALDGEVMAAKPRRGECAAPAVIAERGERRAGPFLFVDGFPQQRGAEEFMAIGVDVGFDRDGPPDDPLDGERAAIDARRDLLDDDARPFGGVDQRAAIAARAFDNRLRARNGHDPDLSG